MDDTSVKVAVRVRPQLAKERIDMCQICTLVTPDEPQIVLGKDKAFTFDYVFDLHSHQEQIYLNCCKELIDGTFEGYNATIFAYGQTGSGKTYSMGTGFDLNSDRDQTGIIPRAVEHLFNGIDERRRKALDVGEPAPDFKVNAQFMELYNEEILDLLDTTRDPSEKGRKSHIRIHEDATGGIYTVGVTTRSVTSLQDTIQCLKMGALSRTTASTNMNAQSSRSHAIFTLHIRQQRLAKPENLEEDGKERDSTEAITEFEMLSAKFHFVDLAGSERLKRTGATGDRAKEGISINCGLLALGNVISALGDKTKKCMHVPYRDSKLTRLLQDSLGGNSRTVMIACISPSDRDFVETLNTLKYANRARNIKNKVTVNQDKTSKQISSLRTEIQALQAELLEYKTGKRGIDAEGVECVSDMFQENSMLQAEINGLRQRIKALQETVETLTLRNIQLLAERDAMSIAAVGTDALNEEAKKFIEGYIKEMEELRTRLIESESQVELLRRTAMRLTPSRMSLSPMTGTMSTSGTMPALDFNASPDEHIQEILSLAKRDLRHLKHSSQNKRFNSQSKNEGSDEEKQDNEYSDFDDIPDKEEANGAVNGDEMEDEEDGEEEDLEDAEDLLLSDIESDLDDEDQFDGVTGKLHENLADLTCEISIKQKLIEELELSQRRLHTLKVHYEEKLVALEYKIRETQLERDRVLSSLGDVESHSQEQANKVREEFEKKLNDMQNELKKLEAAKKEHTKLIRNQSHYEKQFKALQNDLSEMKKLKVQLMNKIREETTKNRTAEVQRNKEINQLKKEQRLKDSHIKILEAEKRQKEIVLKRKQEEVESLRRRQRPVMSVKAAGRTGKYEKEPTVPVNPIGTLRASKLKTKRSKFNPKTSKAIWDSLEISVSSIITKKQTIGHMEKDMERWIKQREHLGKKLERFLRKQEKLIADKADEDTLRDIGDQIETLKANISYIQDNINDCQSNIMQMEESKEDDIDPTVLLGSCTSLESAKYLLEHCVSLIINKGLLAAQKDAESKELMAKLHQERMDSTFQRDMLQYLIQDKVDIEIDDSLLSHRNDSDSESDIETSETTSPVDRKLKTLMPVGSNQGAAAGGSSGMPDALSSAAASGDGNMAVASATVTRRDKARRKTATPEDLLFAGGLMSYAAEGPVPLLAPVMEVPENSAGSTKLSTSRDRTTVGRDVVSGRDATLMPPPKALPPKSRLNGPSSQIPRPDSIPLKPDPSPHLPRKTIAGTKPPPAAPDPSPVLKRKVLSSSVSSGSGSLSRLSSTNDNNTVDMTPPTSPTLYRKSKDQTNVFSRLTSRTQPASPHPTRGIINSVPNRTNQNCPMNHACTASGHSKAVLSVYATDDFLFSSSKDRTAKIWDLQTGEEMLTLNAHPNNVVSVKYSESTNLVYTVSTYVVKVWDPRQGNLCIKTLTSSGLTSDGASVNSTTSRQVACPPGETNITDVVLNSVGSVLYSAAGNTVRIWDLRMYKSVGKLSGGHQAAIMALAIDDTDTADGNICVVTGSKDHYIKVFEVMEDSVGVLCPKYNLEPPHYDGIQSLCLMGDLLFSGSRDTCIKKWDLAEQQLKMSINNAHKDWICGLSFMPGANCLVSGCRQGMLKVWNIENCNLLGEIQAHHSPINAICSNSNMLFSASNENEIKFWWPDCDSIAEQCGDFFE